MADEETLNVRDVKLVQWLSEAHAKEAELEADLTAHISLTRKETYKKRLRKHLQETRDHKKRVASRIKALGGDPTSGPQLPGVPQVVGEVAGKAVSTVKGQVGAARAAVTEQAETHMRNAQEELREEHVEIAIYTRIETFADQVGDKETVQLARRIRRDEERMAKFLDAELQRLVKEVVRVEVPRDQRNSGGRRSSRSRSSSSSSSRSSRSSSRGSGSSSRSSGSSSRSGSSSSRSGSSSSRRSSGSSSRSSGSSSRSGSGSSRSGSGSSRSSSGSSRSSSGSSRSGSGSSRGSGSGSSRSSGSSSRGSGSSSRSSGSSSRGGSRSSS